MQLTAAITQDFSQVCRIILPSSILVGLQGMRERAEKIGGRLNVLSGVDAGTEIELLVPGVLAFQDGSAGRFGTWLPWFYPHKRQGKLQKSSEGQKK